MKLPIKSEDILKNCNGTIIRRIVRFQKLDNKYFVYICVAGFEAPMSNTAHGVAFKDILPLYEIPEFNLDHHVNLFKQMSYDIEIVE